jgi:GMP synthase-like glutamine amidotransferase
LGDEYRIKIISSGKRANAVYIERAINKQDSSKVFFSDEYGEKILTEGAGFLDIEHLELEHPMMFVRNNVISILREMLVAKTPKGLARRMDFRDIHPVIERVIGEDLQGRNLYNDDLLLLSKEVSDRVVEILKASNVSSIVKRLDEYAVPSGEDDSCIQTLSLSVAEGNTKYPSINDKRTIPIKYLPRNLEVPMLDDLSFKVRELYDRLIELQKILKVPPITIVEFDNCFTNSLLLKALKEILAEPCFINYTDILKLVRVVNCSLGGGIESEFESIVKNTSPVIILGGSEANASDPDGRRFIERVCMPLIEDVESDFNRRVLAICFGSQVMLEAYGRLNNASITTIPGPFKFGAFPVAFQNSEILQELSGGIYSLGLTHGWYSDCTGTRPVDMRPIAFEADVKDGKLTPELKLPPLGFSLCDGKLITTQFHPELQLTGVNENNALISWIERNYGYIARKYEANGLKNPKAFFSRNFSPNGISKKGIVPWITRDAGQIFLLNVLLKLTKDSMNTR